jgi:MATE family multidrug resistance protein
MLPVNAKLNDELRQFFIIALPLSAAYLAEFSMFLTTKMVVGKLGYYSLAAVGIAGDLSFEVLLVLMGLLSVIGVLAAQALGAGKKAELGEAVKQGMLVATALGIPAIFLIWNLDLALIATQQDPKVVELAQQYLKGLCTAVLPVLWFSVFRNFVAVLSQTVSILIISVLAVALNYLLTIWLVFGGFGIEPLGLFGAGLATSLVSWFMFLALAIHIYRKPMFRGFGIFREKWRIQGVLCREIFWLGLPVAGLAFLEAGLFAVVAILSGVIGAKTLAAYEITAAWIGIPFVIAFGLAEATMIRVAHAIGSGSMANARRAGYLGMKLVVGITLATVIVPLQFSDQIISIFITPEDPGFERVSTLATGFLHIGAFFIVFDALQATSARALRAMKDNIMPLWIAGFGYWFLGIGGGSIMAFYYDMGGNGLWWGLAAGLAVAAFLLTLRFDRFTRRKILESLN